MLEAFSAKDLPMVSQMRLPYLKHGYAHSSITQREGRNQVTPLQVGLPLRLMNTPSNSQTKDLKLNPASADTLVIALTQQIIQAQRIPGIIKVRVFLTKKLQNESDFLIENTNPESQKNNIIAKAEITARKGSGKTLCSVRTNMTPRPFALSTHSMRLCDITYHVLLHLPAPHIIKQKRDFALSV